MTTTGARAGMDLVLPDNGLVLPDFLPDKGRFLPDRGLVFPPDSGLAD